MPAEKIDAIQDAVLMFKDEEALTPVKEYLGDNYSWGEIRAVLAAIAGSERR